MEIDMQTRDHWDVLSRALSNSVADDIQGIRKFIAEGTAILNKGLVSVDDITRSSVEKESISAKREKVINKSTFSVTLAAWSVNDVDLNAYFCHFRLNLI